MRVDPLIDFDSLGIETEQRDNWWIARQTDVGITHEGETESDAVYSLLEAIDEDIVSDPEYDASDERDDGIELEGEGLGNRFDEWCEKKDERGGTQ